ncbi:MAG: hypothetical protein ACRCZF_13610 [Gemmataceae bacterium]
MRRHTFADAGWADIVPITDPVTRTTRPSRPGTFQVKPTLAEANNHMPQSPFASGLNVAYFDGSVRTLKPNISESTFWSMVTREGGEVVPAEHLD